MIAHGCIPYRLGIQSVKLLPGPKDAYAKLSRRSKEDIGPNNALVPGRYGPAT